MAGYIKKIWPEYVLSIFIAAAISRACFSGFYMSDNLSRSFLWIVAAAAVFNAFCFAAAYRRALTISGIVLAVLGIAGAFWYAASASIMENEEANSIFIFFAVSFLSSLLTFLLGRTRPGIVVLFAASVFINAFVNFLKFPSEAWCFFVPVISCFILFMLRTCRLHVLRASLGRINIKGYAVQSLLVCLAGAAVSAGLYYGAIRALNPPTESLKMITELKRMDILRVLGVSDTQIITDPDLMTDTDPDRSEQSDSDKKKEEQQEQQEQQETKSELADEEIHNSDLQPAGINTNNLEAIRYSLMHDLLLLKILAGIVILIILLCVLRLVIRKRWQRRVSVLSADEAAVNIYRYCFKRLERMGLKKQNSHSFSDYASLNEVRLSVFKTDRADFKDLTRIYERVIYGGSHVNLEEREAFEGFFRNFHKNLKREIGTVKYFLTLIRY